MEIIHEVQAHGHWAGKSPVDHAVKVSRLDLEEAQFDGATYELEILAETGRWRAQAALSTEGQALNWVERAVETISAEKRLPEIDWQREGAMILCNWAQNAGGPRTKVRLWGSGTPRREPAQPFVSPPPEPTPDQVRTTESTAPSGDARTELQDKLDAALTELEALRSRVDEVRNPLSSDPPSSTEMEGMPGEFGAGPAEDEGDGIPESFRGLMVDGDTAAKFTERMQRRWQYLKHLQMDGAKPTQARSLPDMTPEENAELADLEERNKASGGTRWLD